MSAFSERLRQLVGGKRQISAFARECGLSNSTVRQYLSGSVPGLDKVIQIAKAKNVSVQWLATGEGPRDNAPSAGLPQVGTQQEQTGGGMVQPSEGPALDGDLVTLPQLSLEASAGQGIVPVDEEIDGFLAFKAQFLRHIGVDPRNAHVLRIKGNSMYPTLRDRDIVIIDASLIDVLEEGLYTLVYSGAVLAKRLQPLIDGSVIISSDNKDEGYRDETVHPSERHNLKVVGRIKGVVRHF